VKNVLADILKFFFQRHPDKCVVHLATVTPMQADRQAERQTDGWTDRQKDRQTDRQADQTFPVLRGAILHRPMKEHSTGLCRVKLDRGTSNQSLTGHITHTSMVFM